MDEDEKLKETRVILPLFLTIYIYKRFSRNRINQKSINYNKASFQWQWDKSSSNL